MNNVTVTQGSIRISMGPGYCSINGTTTAAIMDGSRKDRRASTTVKFTDITLEIFPGPDGTLGHIDIHCNNMDVVKVSSHIGESDEVPEA